MSVSAKDVERIAALAELAVAPDELPELSAQLDRIVRFVAQLEDLGTGAGSPWRGGPAAAPLREDVVQPAALSRPVAALAPEFVDGFFVVPRLGAMDES